MGLEFLMAGLGLIILLLAGDVLVRGAVNLSLRLGIPALVVSLTVVAFGTSAPELLITLSAIHEGVPGLAMGNVVGSNTANILLVLGVPALVSGLNTAGCDVRKSYVIMLASSSLFIAFAFFGAFTWWQSLILLSVLAGILFQQAMEARSHMANAAEAIDDLEEADPEMRWWKIILFLLLGLIGLPLGADLLVESATAIAADFGVSDAIIGLTLVAVGTSLPELATTVMAALRRQADVALGNVIGSNMFNLLGIIGVAGLVGPIPVDPEFLRFDLWVMLAASLIIAPFVFFSWNMGRAVGLALSALYVTYIVALLV